MAAAPSATSAQAPGPNESLDLLTYFENLKPAVRSDLYTSPWICLAVFRNLAPLARTYIMRLLYVPEPFAKGHWDSWAQPAARSAHAAVTRRLLALGVLLTKPAPRTPGGALYALHPGLKRQLQEVVSCGPALVGDPVAGVGVPPAADVEAWAARQWEALQLCLLKGTEGEKAPQLPPELHGKVLSLDVAELLRNSGLAIKVPGAERRAPLAAGAQGFQWLLQPRERQLWTVLNQYVKDVESRAPGQLGPSLSFLLQLGFRRVGQPCAWSSLSGEEQDMAGHMAQLGLLMVYYGPDGNLYYTPTRLASSLCGGGGGGGGLLSGGSSSGSGASAVMADAASTDGGFIIVESNYRVYAYTSSAVAAATLELFCRREALLPNLFVGSISRDTVLAALERGIAARDLINYLQQHPHPVAAARSPAVPEVVTDQVLLWEASTKRFEAVPCVLYFSFESAELWQRTRAHAAAHGWLLWEDTDPAKPRMAISDEGHNLLKVYVQAAKKELGL